MGKSPERPPLQGRQQAIDYLMGRINYERTTRVPYGERQFKLDRMRNLARRLGSPHARLPVVHIAGSKGKGSTSIFISQVLAEAGYRTGLFTSPHLQRLEERIIVDGRELDGAQLSNLVEQVVPVVDEMDRQARQAESPDDVPTFFEILTIIAMLHFQQQQVDVAVMEVGLGGRLDSTNICHPICTVITSISLDHTRQLGTTHDKIAAEKAGIIKSTIPVLSGVQHPLARQVIEQVAQQQAAPLWQIGDDFDFDDYRPMTPHPSQESSLASPLRCQFNFRWHPTHDDIPPRVLTGLQVGMLGRHQAKNAAIATATLTLLNDRGWKVPEVALRQGLARASCRARVEVLSQTPTVILDAAHNEASVAALLETLDEHCAVPRPQRLVVFGTTRGKDVKAMLARLIPWCGEIVFTQYQDNPRGYPPQRLLELATQFLGSMPAPATANAMPLMHTVTHPAQAWKLARELATPRTLVCITGSFFLAAELEPLLKAELASAAGDSPASRNAPESESKQDPESLAT